jgi:hypothetical protein
LGEFKFFSFDLFVKPQKPFVYDFRRHFCSSKLGYYIFYRTKIGSDIRNNRRLFDRDSFLKIYKYEVWLQRQLNDIGIYMFDFPSQRLNISKTLFLFYFGIKDKRMDQWALA